MCFIQKEILKIFKQVTSESPRPSQTPASPVQVYVTKNDRKNERKKDEWIKHRKKKPTTWKNKATDSKHQWKRERERKKGSEGIKKLSTPEEVKLEIIEK